jgi:AraC-like DNA-binding protein
MCYKAAMSLPFAWYREFAPCPALRREVYAFFSFVPGPAPRPDCRPLIREVSFRRAMACAPQFADGHVSIRFELGRACNSEGRWRAEATALGGTVIGPMRHVGRTEGLDLSETVGAYLRPAASRLFDLSLSDLTDRSVDVGDIWRSCGAPMSSRLADSNEAARVDLVESFLLARLSRGWRRTGSLDVEGLAADVMGRAGRVTIDGLARAAGVSRQHLERRFRQRIGIGPKRYARLARFQSVLAHASSRRPVDWAGVALDAGFADQSHMIAECREFSGLTPEALAKGDWFHPFMEQARSGPRR